MSDALGSGSVAAERSPTVVRMIYAVGRAIRAFPVTLLISVTVSALLVIFVGLLIAFMQYQGRLMRAKPALLAPDMLQYVIAYRTMNERFKELNELSIGLTKRKFEVDNIQNEIDFRISRICRLFHGKPTEMQGCLAFLSDIPFASADSSSLSEGVQNASSQSSGHVVRWLWPFSRERTYTSQSVDTSDVQVKTSDVQGKWADASTSVRRHFVEIMGGPERDLAGSKLEDVIELYAWDIEQIARKNFDLQLKLKPDYASKFERQLSTCNDIVIQAAVVQHFHKIDTSVCAIATTRAASPNLLQTNGGGTEQKRDLQAGSVSETGAAPLPAGPTTVGQSPTGSSASDAPAGSDVPDVLHSGVLVQLPSAAGSRPDVQTTFELVSNYRFYDGLLFGLFNDFLLSPSDFLALALVCCAGMLGALLRVVFFSYVSGRDPSARNIFIGPILGLICALVVYILFRAGFIVITDRGSGSDEATLSPFVIAIMSMSAGLLAERAIDLLRHTSGAWLGSAEASQASRWAMRLQQEVEARGMTLESLAARLDVSAAKLADWAAEKEMVPVDKQREIALVLDLPVRLLFTDLSPQSGRIA